ncbi:cytochrome P450 2U1-like [Ciona intestinalis]
MLVNLIKEFDMSIVLTASCAFVLILYYWYKRPRNFPPGPRGIPLLGMMPFLGKHTEKDFRRWSKKYGPMMSVRLGQNDWIVLGDHKTINECLVKGGSSFSGRPDHPVFKVVTKNHGVAMVDYGDHWKVQRRFRLTTLRGFGVGKRGMEDRIVEEIAYLNDAIRSHNGKAFDIAELMANGVSNNISSIVMGQRMDYDDEIFKILSKKAPNSDASGKITKLVMYMPFIRNFLILFFNKAKEMKKINTSIREAIVNWVSQHKSTYDEHNVRDFIDAFIGEQKREADVSFTDLQLIQYVRDLYVAGTETTTGTLRWAVRCLIDHPEEQNKLRKEIFDVIGREKIPSMKDKAQMPYTCAFMQELFRFRTLAPLGVPHKITNDVQVEGWSIPKGTWLVCNLWAVHNDPDVWDEPSKFKPERHLDEKGNFVQSKHVIPFSVGPRHCLGEQLARMEIFIFLVSMVQKFEFLPDPNEPQLSEVQQGVSGFMCVPHPFKQIAKEV